MITLSYPKLMPMINAFPFGLLPLFIDGEDLPTLIVKATKEYILAAKIKKMIKLHLVPINISNNSTYGLVTSFIDDEDEPLVIKTPLGKDELITLLLKLLRSRQININFFDELSRERLVYRAEVIVPAEIERKIDRMIFLELSYTVAIEMIEKMEASFASRTSVDDEQAICISFIEPLYKDGIFIQDMRPKHHSYHGARGHSHTMLEREEPGSYQEEDLVQCLLLVFSPEQIYLNPKRTYDKEEMCDILVVTKKNILIIQAKDSPNIERIIRQKLVRKRKNILSALDKAAKQVKGAIGYYNRNLNKLEFLIDSDLHIINTEKMSFKSIIVVKELFDDQFGFYTPIIFDILQSKNIPCYLLDYFDFYQFCKSSPTEEEFFRVFDTLMGNVLKEGKYIRPRFKFHQ